MPCFVRAKSSQHSLPRRVHHNSDNDKHDKLSPCVDFVVTFHLVDLLLFGEDIAIYSAIDVRGPQHLACPLASSSVLSPLSVRVASGSEHAEGLDAVVSC